MQLYIRMATKVVQVKSLGNVRFVQNSRSRNIRLTVKADRSILVSFPVWVTFREAAAFAGQQTGWILERLSEKRPALPDYTPESIVESRFHTVSFEKQPGSFSFRINGSRVLVGIPEGTSMQSTEFREVMKNVMTEIYRLEAQAFLPGRIAELAQKHGFRYNRITIRNNRSNWGSCSARNHISLNLHLMRLPASLTDFILLHELVHTRVKNHGPAFWQMLDAVTGGQARRLAQEVKKENPRVF